MTRFAPLALHLAAATALASPARSDNPLPEAPAMTDQPHALALDVGTRDGMLEVRLTARSQRTRAVSYTLEVTGRSTSRHAGSTTLAAGTDAVLSTMRTEAGENWCVTLVAEEDGGEPYRITHGPCRAG